MNIKRLTRRDYDAMQGSAQPPFDVSKIQPEPGDEVEAGIRDLAAQAHTQSVMTDPLPEYVKHDEETPRPGQLAAEAVVKDYEATAQAIEKMASELVSLQQRVEAEVAAIHKVNEELRAAAQRARDDGKEAFGKIERLSKLSEDIRQQCSALTDQLYKQF